MKVAWRRAADSPPPPTRSRWRGTAGSAPLSSVRMVPVPVAVPTAALLGPLSDDAEALGRLHRRVAVDGDARSGVVLTPDAKVSVPLFAT